MREIALDTETTGLDPKQGHRIVEIGCVEMINKIRTGKNFHVYINPARDMPIEAFNIHGISTEFLSDKKFFADHVQEFVDFLQDSPLVIHNAAFDLKFINYELERAGKAKIHKDITVIDTLLIARKKFPGSPANLDALCKRYKVDLSARDKHGALLDAELLSEVYLHLSGGNQVHLKLDNQPAVQTDEQRAARKKPRAIRKFTLSALEDTEHRAYLLNIKNPLWDQLLGETKADV